MSFEDFLNATVEVWRPTVTSGTYGAPVETFGAAPVAMLPMRVNPEGEQLVDQGPGEIPYAIGKAHAAADADVEERDVLKVLTGPEAPGQYRVIGKRRPAGVQGAHHTKLAIRPEPAVVLGAG